MHSYQRCSVFIAVTDILFIAINLVSTIRDMIIGGHMVFKYDPLNGYFWKLVFPLGLFLAIVYLVAAIYLYKGAVNKIENHFVFWIFVHGIISGLATLGCVGVFFYPWLPSSLFTMCAMITCVLWAKWIIVIKGRRIILNEALEAENGIKKLNVNDAILKF